MKAPKLSHIKASVIILFMVPILIGAIYIIFLDSTQICMEWGALSTWYIGVFSVTLLYKTLKSQEKAISENQKQYASSKLREDIIFFIRILKVKDNAANIRGEFSYVANEKGMRLVTNKPFKGEMCFKALLYETKILRKTLSQGKKPDDTEVVYKEYSDIMEQLCNELDSYFNEGRCDFEIEDKCKNIRKEQKEISDTYLYSILAEKYSIPNDWWNNIRNEDDADNYIRENLLLVQPEFSSFFNTLYLIDKFISDDRELLGDTECDKIESILQAALTSEQKSLWHLLREH